MATDDFDRADATSLGGNWTNLQGSIDIVSNQAKTTTGSTLERAYYTAVTFPDNQYSQVVAAGVGTNAFQGPLVRGSDAFVFNTSGNAYFIVWSSSGAGQGLYKLVNGVTSLLQSITGSLSANDLLKLDVSGSTIQCFKNGSQVGSDESDAALTSGSPGVYNTQNGGLNAIFDDWQGGGLGLTAYPIADITDGSWTPSTGTDLYATIDEAVTDDADYDRSGASPDDDVMEVRLTALGIPDDGDVTFTVRHKTA